MKKNGSVLCGWCRTTLPFNRKGNTPVILKLKINYVLIDKKRVRKISVRAGKLTCDFHCMIALAKDKFSSEVEENGRLLHQIMHPKAGFLKSALNYELLDINDGSMDYETYKNCSQYTFVEINGLVVNFAKRSIAAL